MLVVTSFFKETTRVFYYSSFRFILKELDFLISCTLKEELDLNFFLDDLCNLNVGNFFL